jgi:GT2 family glycosyltransferase
MVKEPFISIIISNLNGEKWLPICIPSIFKSNYAKDRFEVIVGDDASKDKSNIVVQKFQKRYKNLKLCASSKSLGWSGINNFALPVAKGEIVVFLSNDMKVDKNWLIEIVKVFADRSIGIIQCNSKSMDNPKKQDSGMNFVDRFGFLYGYSPAKVPTEVFFAEGMAFAVKRELIKKGLKLDSDYFMEYDDADLCWRTRLLGYKVFFAPKSIVLHARGGTVGKTVFERPEFISRYARNQITTLIKVYTVPNLLIALPVILFFQAGKMFYLTFILKSPLAAIATLKGLFMVFPALSKTLDKRRKIQRSRVLDDKEIMKAMVPFNLSGFAPFLATQKKKGERYYIPASKLKNLHQSNITL